MMEKLMRALERLVAFRKECEESEYTDTGEAWELINQMARVLNEQAELNEKIDKLHSAWARHEMNKGYTHLLTDDLAGAIINVLKAAGLED